METAYQQHALRSANGVELILALYDGAIRFLYQAIASIEHGDVARRRLAVKRAVDILMYLQARLRPDVGPQPAQALHDFYSAMFRMTLEASHAASKPQFEAVIACIRNVREAWQVVAQDPDAQKLMPRDLRSLTERYSVSATPAAVPLLHEAPASPRWSA